MMFRPVPARAVLAIASAGSLLAACSSSAEDEATPEDVTAPVLATDPIGEAPDGSALAEGEWFIEEDAAGASARFGPPASEAILSLVCDASTQTLSLTRAGEAEEMQTYVLEAGGTAARVDMTPTGGELPMLRAEFNPGMAIFREFAESGNFITVAAPDGGLLRLPAAPGIARVIEACSRT